MVSNTTKIYKHLSRQLISLAALAKRWDLDRKTVRKVLAGVGIQAFIFCGKRNGSIRYPMEEIENFLPRPRGEIKPQK